MYSKQCVNIPHLPAYQTPSSAHHKAGHPYLHIDLIRIQKLDPSQLHPPAGTSQLERSNWKDLSTIIRGHSLGFRVD